MSTAPYESSQDPSPRTAEELREQWDFFADPEFDKPSARSHTSGVRQSLLWVMGKRAAAPVSGVALSRPPTMSEIAAEAEHAYEGMSATSQRGREWNVRHGGGFLQGCEHALFWAAKLGDDEDWGI
ncbi:hypothetical protein AB0F17_65785 [Nonomuraea sp. NPDC026600]|uniref:hypothetical protein n=1 Tax=Nonomuraea sp. NPDC026600 TaxID=3155363 RepID=UPI003404E8E3